MVLGLQKLTLLDYPGKVACTLFTSGCNFSCPFCHNAFLVNGEHKDELFPVEEIMDFLKKRAGLLDGVCITGGEPLLHEETLVLIDRIRDLGYQVKLDTNGAFPERLAKVLEGKKVDHVAMDIKNSPEKYTVTSGNTSALPKVCESVELLKKGLVSYEFRTTVTGNLHTKEDFVAIGKWIKGAEKYFLQPFLDSGEVLVKDPGYAVETALLEEYLAIVKEYVPQAAIRGR